MTVLRFFRPKTDILPERNICCDGPGQVAGRTRVQSHVGRLDIVDDVRVRLGVHPEAALLGSGKVAALVLLPGDEGRRHPRGRALQHRLLAAARGHGGRRGEKAREDVDRDVSLAAVRGAEPVLNDALVGT